MNPANFFREEPRRAINGPRPFPLRINKDSHVIQKPSSINQVCKAAKQQNASLNAQQARQPVIIYTYSPKVIHTKPKDFMALVQKLTGFSRSEEEIIGAETKRDDRTTTISHEDNDSSSVTSDDKREAENNASDVMKESSSAVSPVNKGLNPYLTDIPLFTPNSNNLFSSPQPAFRNIVGSLSPSFLEFMKGLPEY